MRYPSSTATFRESHGQGGRLRFTCLRTADLSTRIGLRSCSTHVMSMALASAVSMCKCKVHVYHHGASRPALGWGTQFWLWVPPAPREMKSALRRLRGVAWHELMKDKAYDL